MAQDVTIAGASYEDVPSIDVPTTGGGTSSFFDVSDTTATAADVASGKVFYAANGVRSTGTASGGSGSSWTHIAHDEHEISTTSTSVANIYTFYTESFPIGTAPITTESIVYIRVRDKAGGRAGYFVGSDTFAAPPNVANGDGTYVPTSTFSVAPTTYYLKSSTSSPWVARANASSSSYGVFPRQITYQHDSASGPTNYKIKIVIGARYSANYSGTIDGTYSIDVFALDYPDGYPSPFTS